MVSPYYHYFLATSLTAASELLDDFTVSQAAKAEPSTSAPSTSGPGRPSTASPSSANHTSADALPDPESDDFTRQMQAGMAELMQEFENNPELAKQMEGLLQGLQEENAGEGEGDASEAAPVPPMASTSQERSSSQPSGQRPKSDEESFAETIKRTMERMQSSEDQATSAAQSGGGEEDFLEQLLKGMPGGAAGANDMDEEGFTNMLLGMMEQLMNKEALYEPMKELDEKFPTWIEKNKGKVAQEDMNRYEEQRDLAREIVAKFEQPGYKDESVKDREYIVERMQKVSYLLSLR